MPCLAFSVRFLVLTERASPVDWSQSALIAPVREELSAGVWRIPVQRSGSESEVVFGQAFQSERMSRGGSETEASALVREVGKSQKRAPFLLGQAFRSEIGSSFWPIV